MTVLQKKVCLLGDFAVGKTSLIRRFVYHRFDDKYLSTIGVKITRKTLEVEDPAGGEPVELALLLWDLTGGEEFASVMESYLRGAAGAVVVCDLTRPSTLGALSRYAQLFLTTNPGARLVFAANKVDLTDEIRVGGGEVEAAIATYQAPCFMTSAKTGQNVEELFQVLGQLLCGRSR